jgi:hypothetical protein
VKCHVKHREELTYHRAYSINQAASHRLLSSPTKQKANFSARLAQLSALWYLDWLLNLPVFLPI